MGGKGDEIKAGNAKYNLIDLDICNGMAIFLTIVLFSLFSFSGKQVYENIRTFISRMGMDCNK